MMTLRRLAAAVILTCSIFLLYNATLTFPTVPHVDSRVLLFRSGTNRDLPHLISQVFYINLNSRGDRKVAILRQLAYLGFPHHQITRVEGVVATPKALGCSQSHLIALKACAATGKPTCLIMEDDFEFNATAAELSSYLRKMRTCCLEWDVVMLGAFIQKLKPTVLPFLVRIEEAQTTSAYLIHRPFLASLIDNVQQSVSGLRTAYRNGRETGPFCIDQIWKRLQPQSEWFAFNPLAGFQAKGFSDIEQRVVTYLDRQPIFLPSPTVPVYLTFTMTSMTANHRGSWKDSIHVRRAKTTSYRDRDAVLFLGTRHHEMTADILHYACALLSVVDPRDAITHVHIVKDNDQLTFNRSAFEGMHKYQPC